MFKRLVQSFDRKSGNERVQFFYRFVISRQYQMCPSPRYRLDLPCVTIFEATLWDLSYFVRVQNMFELFVGCIFVLNAYFAFKLFDFPFSSIVRRP